eukprot:GILJ01002541.1.p1 GENE.GILJ01002541.1~~GILJ01002541.1.p1  ORF type:complete len:376 (-),score=57.49 GILJ01002541.1:140-1228(-)
MTRVLLSVLLVATAVLLANAQAVDFSTHSQNASTLYGNWIANSSTAGAAFFSPSTTPDGTTPEAGGFTIKGQNNNNNLYLGAGISIRGASSSDHGYVTLTAGGVDVMRISPKLVEIFGHLRITGNISVTQRSEFSLRPGIDLVKPATFQVGGNSGPQAIFLGRAYNAACGTTCAISDEKVKTDIQRLDTCSSSKESSADSDNIVDSLVSTLADDDASSCTSFAENSTISRMRQAGRYNFQYIQGLTPCDNCEHTGWMAQTLREYFPDTVDVQESAAYTDYNTQDVVSQPEHLEINTKKIIPHLWDGVLDLDSSIKSLVKTSAEAIRQKDRQIADLRATLVAQRELRTSLSESIVALETRLLQ